RILHEAHTAGRLDRDESRDAVATKPGEQHARDTGAERVRRGTEEGIDRGPRHVLARSTAQPRASPVKQEMPIAWRDIYDTALQPLIVVRLDHLERRVAPQHPGQLRFVVGAP